MLDSPSGAFGSSLLTAPGTKPRSVSPAPFSSALLNTAPTTPGRVGITSFPQTGYGTALDYYTAQSAVPSATIALQQSQARTGAGFATAGQQLQRDALHQDYGIQTSKLGNAVGGVDVAKKLAAELLGLQNAGFDIDSLEANQRAATQDRGLRSDATARGAYTTPGLKSDLGDVQSNLANTQGRIGLSRKEADLRYRQTQDELDRRAKDLGLDRKAYDAQLQQGLAKLNLDGIITASDLAAAITSGDFQQQQIAESIIRQAQQNAAYFPQGSGVTTSPTYGAGGRMRVQ